MSDCVLDHKQFFRNVLLLPHDQPDLLDAVSLAQVGVNQQRCRLDRLAFHRLPAAGKTTLIAWLQHRADGWYLVGFVGDEMNVHSKAS